MTQPLAVRDLEAWGRAAEIDPPIQLGRAEQRHLLGLRIAPEPYSRARMMSGMSEGEIRLFSRSPVRTRLPTGSELARVLGNGFARETRCRVQLGPTRVTQRIRVAELFERWIGQRGVLNVTDLAFRGSRVERIVDPRRITDFNLLLHGSEELALREIMTFVVSSKGAISDCHTDDADGTNHCIVGRKVWLAWDRLEGKAHGFQDTEYDDLAGQWARFDVSEFTRLRSASWFVVEPGRVVFLPGNYAHRVVTMERYAGIGGFYVSLPGFLRTLVRWAQNPPLDINRALLEELTDVAIEKLAIAGRTRGAARRWGLWHTRRAHASWARGASPEERVLARTDPELQRFLAAAGVDPDAVRANGAPGGAGRARAR